MNLVYEKLLEVGGTVGTSLIVLWFIVKGLKKKSDHHDMILQRVQTDVAVIKTQVLSALSVAVDVKEHDRTLVGHAKDIDKNARDINAQHQKIRDVELRFSNNK